MDSLRRKYPGARGWLYSPGHERWMRASSSSRRAWCSGPVSGQSELDSPTSAWRTIPGKRRRVWEAFKNLEAVAERYAADAFRSRMRAILGK